MDKELLELIGRFLGVLKAKGVINDLDIKYILCTIDKEEYENKLKELYSKDKENLFKAIFAPFAADIPITSVEDKNKEYSHVCATCAYRENNYGYSQCYAQKNAPKIENLNDTCNMWKASDEE